MTSDLTGQFLLACIAAFILFWTAKAFSTKRTVEASRSQNIWTSVVIAVFVLLMVFNREPVADATKLKHTTLAIARLRFLFIAAKIWSHAGRTGIHYSDQYQEQGLFQRLMTRLRSIKLQDLAFRPVLHPALK